jgi:signal transduction histidine kinase
MGMTQESRTERVAAGTAASFLEGGGELGALMRAYDWAQTPLGPVAGWPQSLRSAVSILLPSKAQIVLFWGPDLITLYNDAYRPVFGGKHPRALGKPVRESWSEIWHTGLSDLFEGVLRTGEAFWAKDRAFVLERHGYPEETFFDVSYDPVRDESGGVGGVFCIVSETTGRVLGERRLKTLRDLAARNGNAASPRQACALSLDSLAGNPHDLPFALLYLAAAEGERPVFVCGTDGTEALAGLEQWPSSDTLRTNQVTLVRLDPSRGPLPTGAWSRAPEHVAVIPIGAAGAAGFLVAGLNPFRPFDEDYRGFLELVGGQVAAGVANAEAREQERRRAESLAQLDRAKTAFFSNVSHEFRTPLTLMLGPLEDTLAEAEGLSPAARERLEVAQRNSVRLLKLVNALLDFSRIEAGRIEASYEPTNLSTFTAELASLFRSAVERAGLRFRVDCPPLEEPVYVDREMWEKIVFNLLSNAFKFTFEGEIEVGVRREGDHVALRVRDTGVGIPPEDLSHLFERFHRGKAARGRTLEGSGIGLALVQELVKLHGGRVAVESATGQGSVFTVWLPLGPAHLPPDRIRAARALVSTGLRGEAYVQELLGWLPAGSLQQAGEERPRDAGDPTAAPPARILLADDNADVREYVRRLLAQRYEVEAVGDGRAALTAARAHKPDLVLTDVMMPGLDGFELLRELRADDSLKSVPVVMLSARAGEEARVEGLAAGADDYLVKPISARELHAHVSARLELSRMHAQLQRELRESARRKDEFLATLSHELRNPLAPLRNSLQLLRLAGQSDPVAAPIHEMMERQVNHLVRLVDDLLEMSRISRGALELRKERLDVAAFVRNAIETSDPLIQAAGHELTVSVPEVPVWVDGDPVRLAQIVANLLNNAAKYTDPGGQIAVHARAEAGTAVISIRDNGCGIAPETLPRVFEMFTRGIQPSGRDQGGLGVGLALARRLTEMHGGTLTARSEGAGRGSEFTLRLPLAPDQGARAVDERRPAAVIPPKRILVVDDNRDSAESMSLLLEFLGADVHVALDGASALQAFETFDPAVVLLDIGMPGMDGYEVVRRMRERFPDRRTAVVALTGWGQAEDRRLAREAGFDHHLVKPADMDTLRTLLTSLESAPPAS